MHAVPWSMNVGHGRNDLLSQVLAIRGGIAVTCVALPFLWRDTFNERAAMILLAHATACKGRLSRVLGLRWSDELQ